MRRTASLVIEGAITLGVAAYFAVEGFSGNTALTVALAVVGLVSLALFVGALVETEAASVTCAARTARQSANVRWL
jgi:hypothetical protein